MKRFLVLAGSVLVGLVLGLAIRRARGPAPLSAVEARGRLPSKERVHAALLRAEIRDLEERLAAVREAGEALAREKVRLQTITQPPPPPSPEAALRAALRAMLGDRELTLDAREIEWLSKDPANIRVLLRIAAEVFREKDWGPFSHGSVVQFVNLLLANIDKDARERVLDILLAAQSKESDLLQRGWMVQILEGMQKSIPADQIPDLARAFRESKDPHFREAVFPQLLKDKGAYTDLIRDAIREGPDAGERSRHLLQAWEKRALPGGELRTMARELMKSDNPGVMILEAQDWVPKFINPLAPQETVALFGQTLDKPIEPLYKAVSMMVMGSIATLFPSQPGRAELDRFVASTDDARLKEFGGKVLSLIDEGKGYAEVRQLNPTKFGFEVPKK